MKTKTFDCVEMKHRGAEKLKEKIDRLTVQQELAFWAERSQELRERQVLTHGRSTQPTETRTPSSC